MRTISVARSDIGRRRAANEDYFAVDEANGVFVVADGLGGHVAGRTASETAVDQFVECLRQQSREQPLVHMRLAIREANSAILARGRAVPYLKGMGTTIAALCLWGPRASIAHIGDSRIYLLRGGRLHGLTLDHSYVCELVFRRRLRASAARSHPNRHVITRALGIHPPAEPDAAQIGIEVGDLFLLCTDGLTGPIEDGELEQMLCAGLDDLEATAGALVDCANARGGHDNTTLVMVRVLPGQAG